MSSFAALAESREEEVVQLRYMLDRCTSIILGHAFASASEAAASETTMRSGTLIETLSKLAPLLTGDKGNALLAKLKGRDGNNTSLFDPGARGAGNENSMHLRTPIAPPKPDASLPTPRLKMYSSPFRNRTGDLSSGFNQTSQVIFTPHSRGLRSTRGAGSNLFNGTFSSNMASSSGLGTLLSDDELLERLSAIEQYLTVIPTLEEAAQMQTQFEVMQAMSTDLESTVRGQQSEIEELKRRLELAEQERDAAKTQASELQVLLETEKAEQLEGIRKSAILLDLQQRNAQLRASLAERFAAPPPPGFLVTPLITMEELEGIIDQNIARETRERSSLRREASECIRDLRSLVSVCSAISNGQPPTTSALLALQDSDALQRRKEHLPDSPTPDEPLDVLLSALHISRVEIDVIRRRVADEYAKYMSQQTSGPCVTQ